MQPDRETKKSFGVSREQFRAEDGVGHEVTSFMIKESSDWFDKFLKQGNTTCH